MVWPQVMDKFGWLQTDRCEGRLRSLYSAVQLYAGVNDGRVMLAGNWMDAAEPFTKSKYLHCPAYSAEGRRYGFAFNTQASGELLAGLKRESIPLIYDSANLARNASDPVTSLVTAGRHRRDSDKGNNVLMSTGKVFFKLPVAR